MPMREWYSEGIWEIMSRNSVREPPIVVPWPHMVSRTGITVVVAERALVRAWASRVRADARLVLFALPGLFLGGEQGYLFCLVCLCWSSLTGSYTAVSQVLRIGGGRLGTKYRPALPWLCLLAQDLLDTTRVVGYVCSCQSCLLPWDLL